MTVENKNRARLTLAQIIEALELSVLTEPKDFARLSPSAGYASDLLSCVMANATREGIWITLQAHANIVAVAALLELAAVIITEGAQPDPATIHKANQEGVALLSTPRQTFYVAGKLWEIGLRGG
jgi:predicted transcriptional regulator